ncbi:MAG: rod shape-determining protein, partial [Patescibacteria group bacterium]|nr:rod shape-determining protein [Patescibacteria group bacterium]
GRNIISGLPKEVIVDNTQIRKALSHSVKLLVNSIKATIEETPPELVADIMERGIFLVGGGSLLRGLNQLVAEQTEMPVKLVEDPLTAVVRGTGMVLEDVGALKNVLVSTQYKEPPR